MTYEILEKEPVTLAELKEVLEKSERELDYRGKKVKSYLETFTKLSPKKAKELKKKLEELNIARLKKEMIVKIIDFLPRTREELKTILYGFGVTLTKEQLEEIIKVVAEYL